MQDPQALLLVLRSVIGGQRNGVTASTKDGTAVPSVRGHDLLAHGVQHDDARGAPHPAERMGPIQVEPATYPEWPIQEGGVQIHDRGSNRGTDVFPGHRGSEPLQLGGHDRYEHILGDRRHLPPTVAVEDGKDAALAAVLPEHDGRVSVLHAWPPSAHRRTRPCQLNTSPGNVQHVRPVLHRYFHAWRFCIDCVPHAVNDATQQREACSCLRASGEKAPRENAIHLSRPHCKDCHGQRQIARE
mmetsp:Transcript_97922/g.277010  ORF Transcript_97922/g.277010 Transcript_97922/m.277010 type:complete len:243 (+) Transcript_97922:564-1292(+)